MKSVDLTPYTKLMASMSYYGSSSDVMLRAFVTDSLNPYPYSGVDVIKSSVIQAYGPRVVELDVSDINGIHYVGGGIDTNGGAWQASRPAGFNYISLE